MRTASRKRPHSEKRPEQAIGAEDMGEFDLVNSSPAPLFDLSSISCFQILQCFAEALPDFIIHGFDLRRLHIVKPWRTSFFHELGNSFQRESRNRVVKPKKLGSHFIFESILHHPNEESLEQCCSDIVRLHFEVPIPEIRERCLDVRWFVLPSLISPPDDWYQLTRLRRNDVLSESLHLLHREPRLTSQHLGDSIYAPFGLPQVGQIV